MCLGQALFMLSASKRGSKGSNYNHGDKIIVGLIFCHGEALAHSQRVLDGDLEFPMFTHSLGTIITQMLDPITLLL